MKKSNKSKELLFSLNASDFEWDYYNGTGNGGSNRNKTQTCCRCTHGPSGAVGKSEDERTQPQNKRLAFKRMAKTEAFQKWVKIEGMRKIGLLKSIEEEVDKTLLDTKVEIMIDNKWVEVPELKITVQDIDNIKELK